MGNENGPSRAGVWRMFDRITGRYDRLNRLLSFRRDVAWRRRLARRLPATEGLRVLDVAAGTGDVLLEACRRRPGMALGVGVDLSGNMLAVARGKLGGVSPRVRLVQGDATCLPARTEGFDAVTIAFGIRNVTDVAGALREMYRVLKPEGRLFVMEFSLPGNVLVRGAFRAYLRHVVPRLGAWAAGDRAAYGYLGETIETFPYGEDFCAMMRNANFKDVRAIPLTLGVATLYEGAR